MNRVDCRKAVWASPTQLGREKEVTKEVAGLASANQTRRLKSDFCVGA